jgi:hypothetical protein
LRLCCVSCVSRHLVPTSNSDWIITSMINNKHILLPAVSLLSDTLCQMQSMHTRQCNTTPLHVIEQINGPARLGTGPGDQPLARVFQGRSCRLGLVVPHREISPLVLRSVRTRRTPSLETGSRIMPRAQQVRVALACIQMSRALLSPCELRWSSSLNHLALFSVKTARRR